MYCNAVWECKCTLNSISPVTPITLSRIQCITILDHSTQLLGVQHCSLYIRLHTKALNLEQNPCNLLASPPSEIPESQDVGGPGYDGVCVGELVPEHDLPRLGCSQVKVGFCDFQFDHEHKYNGITTIIWVLRIFGSIAKKDWTRYRYCLSKVK